MAATFGVTLHKSSGEAPPLNLDAPPSPAAKIQAVADNLRDSRTTPVPARQLEEKHRRPPEQVVLRDVKNTPVPVQQQGALLPGPREEIELRDTLTTAAPVKQKDKPADPQRETVDLRSAATTAAPVQQRDPKDTPTKFNVGRSQRDLQAPDIDAGALMDRVQGGSRKNLSTPKAEATSSASPAPKATKEKSGYCVNFLYLAIGLGALAAVTAAIAAVVIFATALSIAIGLGFAAVSVVSSAGSVFSAYKHFTAEKA